MDLDALRAALSERYPQWTQTIMRQPFQETAAADPVENDGRMIYYNARQLDLLTPADQEFFLAQQLVHLNLSHYLRGRDLNRALWKLASDAVVNQLLRQDGFDIPLSAVNMEEAAGRSAEEFYRLLALQNRPLPEKPPEAPAEEDSSQPQTGQKSGGATKSGLREIQDPGLAAAVAGLAGMLEPSMQLDFDWFPGSTLRDGLIRDDFRPYPIPHAEILLDTSASIDAELLRSFLKGVKALLWENTVMKVGCFDTRFYGFQEIHSEEDIDRLDLRGAGGTDFRAAINAFSGDAETKIIFTDGFAEMPELRCDAIWLVYSSNPIHPHGGRVIYVKKPEEKEKDEIDFLIT